MPEGEQSSPLQFAHINYYQNQIIGINVIDTG